MRLKNIRQAPHQIESEITEGARLLSLIDEPPAILAAKLGVSRACISQWRNGRTRPHEARAFEIMRILGINLAAWNFTAGSMPESVRLAGERYFQEHQAQFARARL
jgi:transcriptional regulator with XRE-family HTH domain